MFKSIPIILFLLLLPSWIACQYFIENKGQWPANVLFRAEHESGFVYLENDRITFDLRDVDQFSHVAHAHEQGKVFDEPLNFHCFRMLFLEAEKTKKVITQDPSKGYFNYFLGNDASKWGKRAQAFRVVTYLDLYPGIDMKFYFKEGDFKYDLIVSPGASVDLINFEYSGVNPKLKEECLVYQTAIGDIKELRPFSYQSTNESILETQSAYKLKGNRLSFELGNFREDLELIIDPVLKFSTFSGSSANNFGYTATFDQAGFLYSGSSVFDQGYPTTEGAYDLTFNQGNVDIGISKFDTTGTFLIYSTYLGGSEDELPHSIIVNELDELYVFGTTGSANYPVTTEAYNNQFSGGFGFTPFGLGVSFPEGTDMIISKLSNEGDELLSSTFVGGSRNDGLNMESQTAYNYADEIRGEIDLDQNGNVLVASCTNGSNNDFPTTSGALQDEFSGGGQDGVIFSLDENLETLLWSTFFGGSEEDAALSITSNDEGHIIVCGSSASPDLLTTTSLQETYQGGVADGYVLVLDPDSQEVTYCTYWGSPDWDRAYMVELDSDGNIHLFGQTQSGDDFIQNAEYSVPNSGQFISKLSPELDEVIWSTTFGNGNGLPNISPTAFLVDVCDRIYLSGWGGPTGNAGLTTEGLETTIDAYQNETNGGDFYLMALADDASELLYASFFGGLESNEHVDGGTSRFDKKGKVYQAVCAGCQGNSDFPFFPSDALSENNGSSGCNLGVFKMDFDLPLVIADFIYNPICLPDSAQFFNTSEGGLTYTWSFGDGEGSNDFQPIHYYTEPGPYEVTLIVSDPMSCNLIDSITKDIFIFDPNGVELTDTLVCADEEIQIGIDPLPIPGLDYSWTFPEFLDDPESSNPIAIVGQTTLFTLVIDNGVCPSTISQLVEIETVGLELGPDTIICDGDEITLTASTNQSVDSYQWSSTSEFTDTLSTDSTLTVGPLLANTYFISVEKNCIEIDSVSIGIFSDFLSFSENQYICANEPIDIQVFNTSQTISLNVEWTPEEFILEGQGTNAISLSTDQDVWILAEVEGNNGCQLIDSVLIEVSPLSFVSINASAEPELIALGEQSQLLAIPSSSYQLTWSPPDGLNSTSISNPLASPGQTTTYTVTITDADINGNCSKDDTVTVKVFEYICGFPTTFVPNAFSPNGDNVNDVLLVRGTYIESLDLKIYDRWGELVFQTQEKDKGWDGTFRGKELEPAVYVYHIDVLCIDGQESFEKGNITLIR
ncbi:MAG: T9SS type B sorting domain-containing protein [Flavobacteriales bacterium]|nr:T9SS type B sorting domain-containing protein [Flavobacteriales bacterium]